MRCVSAVWMVLAAVVPAHGADLDAGKAKVLAVCAACHGAAGVSVSETIPNLAAQRAGYIEVQLKALKDGTRKNPIMNAIAAQLSGEDIANVAAYFAAQPGAPVGAKSDFLPNLAKTGVTFPDGYRESFTKYHTINFPATRQVRYYYANTAAVRAAKEGRALSDGSVLVAEVWSVRLGGDNNPLKGADGFFVPDQLLFYTAMARDAGWGKQVPEMLRNDDWNYAIFTTTKQHRPGANQAECLACHKPLDKTSYVFTLKELAAAKDR